LGIIPANNASVNVDDVIATELKDPFAEASICEVKVDEVCRMTLKIEKGDMRICPRAKVFALDKERSYERPKHHVEPARFPSMTAVVGRIVHPSRSG
jgi:hypothetical protein